MQSDPLVTGLAWVLGAITVVFTTLGAVYNPILLFVALTFGVSTYFVYYHASGRMAARVYRRVHEQAAHGSGSPDARRRAGPGEGSGAGPREEWTPPRDGRTARRAAGGRRRATDDRRRRRQRVRQPAGGSTGPTPREAYRTLDVEPGADEETVTAAYREKVKDVHPDAEGGDEAAFREVQDAYERLTE